MSHEKLVNSAKSRIIDRDVDFYTAEVEFCQERLQRCAPNYERYWANRINFANSLLNALKAYREAVDTPQTR